MPLYDYQCQRCGHRFEVRQGFHDDPVADCPRCGGPCRRLLSPVPIIFKGSGWYVTDYARRSMVGSNGQQGEERSSKSEAKEGAGEAKKE